MLYAALAFVASRSFALSAYITDREKHYAFATMLAPAHGGLSAF
jgi:hypothetical protein